MSPSVYTFKPWLLLFSDCGLGSDPNASGPCTGTYGPGQGYDKLSEPVTSELLGGKIEILAIGAALLALLALIALVRLIRRAATDKSPKKIENVEEECDRCGAEVVTLFNGEALCESCFVDAQSNEASFGEDVTGELQPCSVCGTPTPIDELEGELFPACLECAAAAEADERRREIDAEPDEVEDNPRGVGAGDKGLRA